LFDSSFDAFASSRSRNNNTSGGSKFKHLKPANKQHHKLKSRSERMSPGLWQVVRKSLSEPDRLYNLKQGAAGHHETAAITTTTGNCEKGEQNEASSDYHNYGNKEAAVVSASSLCGDMSFNPTLNNCSSIKSIIITYYINTLLFQFFVLFLFSEFDLF
jgi:hypothetical protein